MKDKILCWLGFHKREVMTIKLKGRFTGENRTLEITYNVCTKCGDGDPRLTGEY